VEDVILGAGTHRTGSGLDRRRNGADLTVVCNDGTGARMYGWCVPQTGPVVASRSDCVLEGMDRLLRLPTSYCCAQVTYTRCRSCRRTVASQFHQAIVILILLMQCVNKKLSTLSVLGMATNTIPFPIYQHRARLAASLMGIAPVKADRFRRTGGKERVERGRRNVHETQAHGCPAPAGLQMAHCRVTGGENSTD
jgi:hypothetical protein